jgi:hypothetical protein
LSLNVKVKAFYSNDSFFVVFGTSPFGAMDMLEKQVRGIFLANGEAILELF